LRVDGPVRDVVTDLVGGLAPLLTEQFGGVDATHAKLSEGDGGDLALRVDLGENVGDLQHVLTGPAGRGDRILNRAEGRDDLLRGEPERQQLPGGLDERLTRER